jgi:hypothetical protein
MEDALLLDNNVKKSGASRKVLRKELIMKIMMYYDGTENSKQALPAVKTRAKAFNAQVDVVSSLPRGGEAQLEEIGKREDDLAYIKSILDNQEIPCETHLLIKGHDAGNDIAHFAKSTR